MRFQTSIKPASLAAIADILCFDFEELAALNVAIAEPEID
jgi:hypothetical protein